MEKRAKSAEKLQAVYEKFEDNAEIAVRYARILVNLSVDQDVVERLKILEKLKMLHEKFESNEEIVNIILELEETV